MHCPSYGPPRAGRGQGRASKSDLTACAIDGSGCTTIASEDDIEPALYADSGRIYWIKVVSTPRSTSGTLLWNDAVAPYTTRGPTGFPGMDVGLRVNGAAVATRAGAEIWTGTVGDDQMTRVWVAPAGRDLDISHERMYWNQRPWGQYPGCLESANLDGTDGKCLDQGQPNYDGVKVDEEHAWYIRDDQIVRTARN